MDAKIEEKWMNRWETEHVFEPDPDPAREKKLVTFPFPYMNGPLHIGHGFTATRVDVYARFKRMQGLNVLFPWAWHWTGQPIVAAAERLSSGDKAMIKEFVEIDKIPLQELPKFYDPKYMAQYYTNSGRTALRRLGLSVDWRREFHTTDLEPTFNKFVLWQYNKLRQKGYVTRGTHPVVWCPRDQSPTGDHDRLEGQGVTWEEYTLILYRLRDDARNREIFLPAATFRPETIFGVTNLWLNPDSEYVEVLVNGTQHWIISTQASEKLKEQLKKIVAIRKFRGKELIGKRVYHLLDNSKQLIILPASFVDPKNGTGIVYSVPGHAPMDYVALRDLKRDEKRQLEYNFEPSEIDAIKPISLISIPGSGELPAEEIVEEMKITDQSDPRVIEATEVIYKKEFHQGLLNKNAGKYQGKRVADAKPLIIDELKQKGLADSMYDLIDRVVCRCLTECIVKILEDQWFLKYSDEGWKKLAHECVDRAQIFPDTARQWFHDVIDWIKDWPCARRVGLGTPLPWSPGWIVETLSDSTIYMAFYTIRDTIVKYHLTPDSLTESFFDYVYFGEGSLESVSLGCGIPAPLIESMRSEFLYWYPVNLRNSAKELIPNHLTFFIFQHVAFFPRERWPTAISANGMMMVDGEKMSKSKGNVVALWSALENLGADALRAALMDGAEGMDDLDWREKNARDLQTKLNSLGSFINSLESSSSSDAKYGTSELWLENQIQKRISSVTSSLESMRTKSAFQEAFYDYWNDIRYYLSRTDNRPSQLVNYSINTWIGLLAPFVPYVAEEINSSRGSSQLVARSHFPTLVQSKIHPEAELEESLLQGLLEDVKKILKLITQPVKSLHIYLAPSWQWDLFSTAVIARDRREKISQTLQNAFKEHTDVDKKEIANALNRITRSINELGEEFLSGYMKCSTTFSERDAYLESLPYLKKQLALEVVIHDWDEKEKYDPKRKSSQALPFKPALFLE